MLAALLAAGSLTACGSGSGSDSDTIKIAYNRNTDNNVRYKDKFLSDVKKQFEKDHPGKKVELMPIQVADLDYAAKVQQMMRTPKTAPDLVYEDTFRINSDIQAGYLKPLDPYLAKWSGWDQFVPTAKASARAQDGKTYGVPDGTDTRGLWFNKKIFQKAGLPANWQPKNWNDILTAARTIKKKVPGVIPLNVYTGKAPGETSVMQSFEMLLYGTGQDPMYDTASKKWVTGSKGFKDSLNFIKTVYGDKLGPDPSDALDPNVGSNVAGDWLPNGKLAIALDGSWLGQVWISGGQHAWPAWNKELSQAPMPTQYGQAPGKVSMSGGWAWAIPQKAANPGLAFDFIKAMQTPQNAAHWFVVDAQISVRKDAAVNPVYLNSMPGIDFFTKLVQYTHYRPALPVYPQVSTAVGEAMESVTTGDATPAGAAKTYDGQLKDIAKGAVVNKP